MRRNSFALLCALFIVAPLNAQDNEPLVGAEPPASLSDGALLLDELDPQASPQESLPVAENVDLKDVVKDEELGAIAEGSAPLESAETTAVENKQTPTNTRPLGELPAVNAVAPVDDESAEKPAKENLDAATEKPLSAISVAGPEGEQRQDNTAETATKVNLSPDFKAQNSLKLLSSEVLPGTSARLAWEPSVSFMGISAPTAVLVVNGVREGPTLCLTSAVHGDELNGIEVVRHILYNIDPQQLSGAIIGVPIVNLQGFRRSSRYLPDRRDMNRYFPGNPNGSAASRIAFSFFDEVVRHCDLLVDIHTGSFKRTNLPQLRADLAYKKVADLAGKMGAIVVVQSRGHAGSLRRAAVEYGVPAVTLEAGEPHILDKQVVSSGIKSIQTLLHAEGMAKTLAFWELRRGPVYYKSRWVRSVNGGILFSDVALGANVKVGDVLGTVTDPITNLSTDIVSPHNGKVIGMALNQVLYPGYAAYHIGLQAPAEEAAEDIIEPEATSTLEMSEDDSDNVEETQREQESEAVMEVQILEDSE